MKKIFENKSLDLPRESAGSPYEGGAAKCVARCKRYDKRLLN
jgi:hypothetical protein